MEFRLIVGKSTKPTFLDEFEHDNIDKTVINTNKTFIALFFYTEHLLPDEIQLLF
jgi:hypothetical protein